MNVANANGRISARIMQRLLVLGVTLLGAGAGGCTSFRQHGSDAATNGHDAGREVAGSGGASSTAASGGAGGSGNGTGGNGNGGNEATGGTAGASGGPAGTGGMVGATGGSITVVTGGAGGAPVMCAATEQKCGAACVPKTSPDFCGPSCMKCPAPVGGTATCNGTSCDFTCGTLKKCPAASLCVPATGCCTNADCPAMAGGQAGTCDSATHQCNYSCPANTQSCTTGTTVTCIPAGGCCKDSDCAGTCKTCSVTTHTCGAAVNVDDPTGRCVGTCNATGICKSKRGQLCSTVAAGCVEGTSCAPDGTCCNTACTGACQACDIPGSAGTCTNVNAGPPHSNHAACGTDPACLGSCSAGACTYVAKTCGTAPSCTGNSSVGQAMCSSGACVTPAPQTCAGGYTCSGTSCRTSCAGTTGCVATSYCNGTTCAPKKAPGQLCATATECASGLCGGRCCNAGAPCTCPQPRAGNLLANSAGFDQNITGWTISSGAGSTASWTGSEDAAGCPFSGALSINSPADTGAETSFSQCVALNSTAVYNVGIQWKVLPNSAGNAGIFCEIFLTSNATCSVMTGGPAMTLILSDLYPVGWSGYDRTVNQGIGGALDNSNGFSHLYLHCSGRNGIAVDMAYVTAGTAGY